MVDDQFLVHDCCVYVMKRTPWQKPLKHLGFDEWYPVLIHQAGRFYIILWIIPYNCQIFFLSISILKDHMDPYGGFLKWGYPQIIYFNWIFHEMHQPFWGSPIFASWKPPYFPRTAMNDTHVFTLKKWSHLPQLHETLRIALHFFAENLQIFKSSNLHSVGGLFGSENRIFHHRSSFSLLRLPFLDKSKC